MSFLQRNLYHPEASFAPLFRLLEDFDNYARQGSEDTSPTTTTTTTTTATATGPSRASPRGRLPRPGLLHWQPRFDVRELDEAFELHGELPGIDKRDVQIEFSDPQTLLIRGRIERAYQAGTPPAGAAGAIEIEAGGARSTRSEPRRAVVEDEEESASHEVAEGGVVRSKQGAGGREERTEGDGGRYWLSERSVGEFSRSFYFPGRVDQEGVSANVRDGILNVRVPKARHEARRIVVE